MNMQSARDLIASGRQELSRDIMMRSPFTKEMFDEVESIIGSLTSWNVLTLLNRYQPSWSAIDFLIERGIIDVCSSEYSVMSYFMFEPIPWQIRAKMMTKLLERGADINEQDVYGLTLLMKFFRACRNCPRYVDVQIFCKLLISLTPRLSKFSKDFD
jgi:hypothetical protein